MIVKFNDRLGSRGIRHLNLLVAEEDGEQFIFDFSGAPIPGVCRVLEEERTRDGKWSHSEWKVELAEGVRGFAWYEDWESGGYIADTSWEEQYARVRRDAGDIELTDTAIGLYIRATFVSDENRRRIAAMDESESILDRPSPLPELLAAQKELAEARQAHQKLCKEVAGLEAAEKALEEAAALHERTRAARKAMAEGASLADLKTMLEVGA